TRDAALPRRVEHELVDVAEPLADAARRRSTADIRRGPPGLDVDAFGGELAVQQVAEALHAPLLVRDVVGDERHAQPAVGAHALARPTDRRCTHCGGSAATAGAGLRSAARPEASVRPSVKTPN